MADLKQQIRDLLEKQPELDEFDIAELLSLGLQETCKVVDEMEQEGQIRRV